MLNLSPTSLFKNIAAAWRLAMGRGTVKALFEISPSAFWQSVWGAFILHLLSTSFASSVFGLDVFLRLSLISLISTLAYIWLVHFLMTRIGKADVFLEFIIPYQWLNALQAILFGGIAVIVLVAPGAGLHFLVIPIVIWMIFRIWKLAKQVMGISGGLAVGFIMARIFLDSAVNFATGVMGPIS